MRGAADWILRVVVQVGECGEFFAGLLVGQRIGENCVLRQFGEANVGRHVVEIGAIVLAHEEELARVAEDGGANAAFFEAAVLLNDGDVPAIELPHLRVALFHDLFAAWDVEKARDFFIDVPLPQSARHRDDVLPRVVGDQESGDGAQQLRGFGNVAEFEVRDLAGQRNVARAVEQAAVVAVGAPRQQARREIAGCSIGCVELDQLLEHSVRRIFRGREVGEREIANFAPRVRFFQKAQRFFFGDFGELLGRLIRVDALAIAEVDEDIESRRAGPRALQFRERASMPGNFEQSIGVATTPFFEDIFVEQHDVFRDLRFARELLVFVAADAGDLGDERHRGREMFGRERQSMRVEIVDRQVAIRLNDDRSRVRFDRPRVDFVRQSFLDDDRVVVERFRLRKQVADSDALAGAAHSEQHGVLRRFVALRTGEGRHADKVPLSAFVERFRLIEMTGESRAERKHVREITCFSIELPM